MTLAALALPALLACQAPKPPLDQSCFGTVDTPEVWPNGPVLAALLRAAPLRAAIRYCYEGNGGVWCGGRTFESPARLLLAVPRQYSSDRHGSRKSVSARRAALTS